MNHMLSALVGLVIGAGLLFLIHDERGASPSGADPELVRALAELRSEVSRLREQIAKQPELVQGNRTVTHRHSSPNGFEPALREPGDPPPPPPPPIPGQTHVVPAAGPVEHVHRKGRSHGLTTRTEKDDEELRKLSSRHDDEEEHASVLKAWMLVQEQEVLRRFGLPDTIRVQDGQEVWVYEGLFPRSPGREVHLRFRHGRLIGVY